LIATDDDRLPLMMLDCRGWPPSAEAQLGGMLIASEFM
jgi:hypothetical protein